MTQKTRNELGPYERKMVTLLKQRGRLKFGEIIMRLGLSANHGQRVIDSLNNRGMIDFNRESNKFRLVKEAE